MENKGVYSCLMYHEVVEKRLTKCSVHPEAFEAQMRELVRRKVTPYLLGNSIVTIPDVQYCLLTFDDGHKSNLLVAHLLSELGLTAYFYIIKDYSLSNAEYLTESEIKEIFSLGHKLGVHGKSHDHWVKMEEKRLVSNLRETKDWIEQLTGESVNTCSAPGGIIDERTICIIKREIPELKYIRTSRYGVNIETDTVLNSIGVLGNYSLEKVMGIAQNDWWTMRKIMSYYHAKEFAKPIYHFFKQW